MSNVVSQRKNNRSARGPKQAAASSPSGASDIRAVLLRSRGRLLPRVLVWVAIAFVGVWVPYVLALYPLQLAVQGTTLGILGVSVGWLRRQTGLLSFGHAMFYGVAGYTTGILVERYATAPMTALLLGILAATALAAVAGMLVVRAGGVAFSMLTLACGMLVWVWVTHNRSLTHGYDGLPISFDGSLLGRDATDYSDPVTAWPLVWLVLMAVIAALWLLSRSTFGRHLVALRENEERTRFTGRTSYLPRVLAFTVSGLVAAIAGAVSAANLAYVSPDSLFWSMSGQALIVAVIGGVGSVWGPPAGAIAYVFLQSTLSDSPYYQVIIGLVLVVVVLVAPGGGADVVTRLVRLITHRGANRA